jgi:hypothetical protein
LAAVLALALPACSLLPTFGGAAEGFVPIHSRPRDERGFLDLKGVIHCHSLLSHDSRGTLGEIEDACKRVGVDFLVMTDHQTDVSVTRGFRGFRGGTLFMVGAELRQGGGSLLAFPLTASLARRALPDVIADAHRQGALVFAGHCEEFVEFAEPGLTGLEVLNLHADVKEESRFTVLLRALAYTPGAFFASVVDRPAGNLAQADLMLARGPCTLIAGNDAHSNVHVLGPLGGTVGTYEQIFRTVSTHVLAEGLDQGSIVEALRRGRGYVAVEVEREATGFSFTALAGGRRVTMGESVAWTPDLVLDVRTPARGTIELLRDGKRAARSEGQNLLHSVREPGVYRVEVELDGAPWIYSNAIRVTGR